MTTDRLAYSPAEAAELLGISRSGIYNMMKSGDIPSITLGRRRLIPHEALTKLLAAAEPFVWPSQHGTHPHHP